ncbi:MAG: excisionase [Qipengyuania sp.]|nr:excisionase [Qipengyuania sp.]
MLAIGKTKLAELVVSGQLETVRIGTRRLVKIASVMRLAGIETPQDGEAW